MPFVTEEHRNHPDMAIPGDRCFREYKYIMEQWTKSPRWGTIDALAERMYPDAYERAHFLAFLVFFSRYAMPYEEEKIKQNGDINALA